MAVNTIITEADKRANTALADAQQYLNILKDLANDVSIELAFDTNSFRLWDRELETNIEPKAPKELSLAERGSKEKVEFDPEGSIDTALLNGQALSSDYFTDNLPEIWDEPRVNEFLYQPQELVVPERPNTELPDKPDTPDVQDIKAPTWVDYEPPIDPEYDEVIIPTPEALVIDPVDLGVPSLDLAPDIPENTFTYEEGTYSSELLQSLQALLSDDLNNGGYGINPDDEAELYARGREREAKQAAAKVSQLRRGTASQGFPIPPGTLYAAEFVALEEANAELARLNREIVLKRSELYVQARQFAVQQGIGLEQALFTFVGAKQERALRAAEAAADFSIKFHNTSVQLFQLRIELRKLYRDLHAEQLQTAATRIQEYGRELEYAGAKDQQVRVKLQMTEALSNLVRLKYDTNRFEDEHTRLEIEKEKLTLEQNRTKMEVYAAEIRARGQEIENYRLQWQGEEVKQKYFQQQLSAHSQHLDAVTKEAALKRDKFSDELRLVEAERTKYQTLIDRQNALIRKEEARISALMRENADQLDIWKTVRGFEKYNIDKQFEYQIEKANKIVHALEANLAQLAGVSKAVLDVKGLNSNAATNALALYQLQIKGAADSLSAIEASIANA